MPRRCGAGAIPHFVSPNLCLTNQLTERLLTHLTGRLTPSSPPPILCKTLSHKRTWQKVHVAKGACNNGPRQTVLQLFSPSTGSVPQVVLPPLAQCHGYTSKETHGIVSLTCQYKSSRKPHDLLTASINASATFHVLKGLPRSQRPASTHHGLGKSIEHDETIAETTCLHFRRIRCLQPITWLRQLASCLPSPTSLVVDEMPCRVASRVMILVEVSRRE